MPDEKPNWVDEIKERLSKSTPGPWIIDATDVCDVINARRTMKKLGKNTMKISLEGLPCSILRKKTLRSRMQA